MNKETDPFYYAMAAEKICNLLFTIENTMDFMEEYKITPDDNVKKVLSPLIENMKKWLK